MEEGSRPPFVKSSEQILESDRTRVLTFDKQIAHGDGSACDAIRCLRNPRFACVPSPHR